MLSRTASTINHRVVSTTCYISQKLIGRSMHMTHRIGHNYSSLKSTSNYKLTRYSPLLCSSFIRSISQESSATNETSVNASSPVTATDNIVQNVPAESVPTNLFDAIPDAPLPPTPEISDLAASLAEPTFASLGLGGWWPTGIVQQLLEMLHVTCGVPWWGTITIGTICVRTILFPLVLRQQRSSAMAHNTLPGLQRIQNKLTEARTSGDDFAAAKISQEMMQYMKTNDCDPLKSMIVPLVQMPIFLSFFFGLKKMANLPVESMSRGGLLWFEDLTVTDPYYLLPLITSVTLFTTMRLGIDMPRLASMGLLRYVVLSMPVIIFPFTINFPAAIVWYWVSTNIFTLLQVSFLKIPRVREFFNIPRLVDHPPNAVEKPKPFVQGFKQSWSNMKLQREMADRHQLDTVQFNKAGRGPIPKTYSYNPMQDRLKKSEAIGTKR